MKNLSHPYIVQLHEVLCSPTKLYIVLELVMGRELFEIINEKGPFSEDTARRFFQQLTDGVNYCHAMQIVHRDLKVSRDTGGAGWIVRGRAIRCHLANEGWVLSLHGSKGEVSDRLF